MLRSFVFLLVLFVVFLTGMLLGIDRERAYHLEEPPSKDKVESHNLIEDGISETEQVIIVDESTNEQAMSTDTPLHLTQKTASFLETGVRGFYEVVVNVLYQFSTLFF